jgi:apolipoprotein N-acyltransferase
VLVVQGAVEPELRWRRVHATRVLRRYAALTSQALGEEARSPALVVWPENAIQSAPDDPTLGPPLLSFVARTRVPLLVGAPRSGSDARGRRRQFNTAHLVGPDGALAHYDKMRLLPFSETAILGDGASRGDLDAGSYAAGREPGLLDAGGERLGLLICFEAIYPGMARTLVRRGATALVNLSNDGWYRGRGGARQHFQLARFRAIETGLPLVRATTSGITAVVAPDGRFVADLAVGTSGSLRAALPSPRPAAYAQVGDVLALACVSACAAALALPQARRGGHSARGR